MADETPKNTSARDEAIDAALDVATGRSRPDDADIISGPSLKKHWDAELDAELEAAMAGFDADAFEVGRTGRLPRQERAGGQAPRGQRGTESRSGPQMGKVIAVRGRSVFVDLGAKSEGVVPADQFAGDLPKPGDQIEVRVDRFDTEEGILLLSLKGAAVEASWENLRKGLIVEARVTKTNKGGLDVEVDGIRGFLPIGQIELGRVEDTAGYVNQKFRVVVTEANQREKNLVVSRRELLEQERAEKREQTWKTLEEGQVHKGVVRSVKDFGAFVEIGGVDGLIHVGDMAWSRVSDASNFLKVGDEVEVKVLKVDRVTQKVGLGLKQLTVSPWDTIDDRIGRGMTIKGTVTRVMDFGAFVEIEPGIEGLVHISELSPNRVRKTTDIVKPGQEVEVRVLKIDPDDKKISLSLKPLPAAEAAALQAEDEEDDAPRPPRPEPKVPLKGGLGDRDPFMDKGKRAN